MSDPGGPERGGRRDMGREGFLEASRKTAEWIARYREGLEDQPVLPRVSPGDLAARVPEEPPERGESFDAILADVDEVVLPGLTHWNHPGFHAYFPSTSSPPAVLAEFLAAAMNQNAMIWRTAPAATELEERMVGWVRRLVGLPDDFAGVIQDTASTSSFVALVAARERLDVDVRRRGLAGRDDLPALTVFVSEEAHSSVEKGAIAAGIGRENMRSVATDPRLRMDPQALAARIDRDREDGRLPVLACATLGTTSSAAMDPVAEVAEVCRERDVWLHVDAAYAGPAAMLPEHRGQFAGWERADSIVLNPHKWMATPIDCSVLLFRDPGVVRRSLALTPPYLRGEEDATNLMDYGLPTGRRFRALKLWFLLRWHGVEGLRSLLRDHIRWAGEFAAGVVEDPRFELTAPPSFSTVCFRALPPEAAPSKGRDEDPLAPPVDEESADAWNARLLEAVNRKGPVFLSHTELNGRYVLRLAVGGEATRLGHVMEALELLGEAYEELSGEEERGSGPVDAGAGRP